MPRRVQLLVAILLAIAPASRGYAVQHMETSALPSRLKLIVIEVPGCFYCRLFRREVLPAYEASPWGRAMPIRFLTHQAATDRRLSFSRPIDAFPTVVLFRKGKEMARISGYLPPENFVRMINYLLSREQ